MQVFDEDAGRWVDWRDAMSEADAATKYSALLAGERVTAAQIAGSNSAVGALFRVLVEAWPGNQNWHAFLQDTLRDCVDQYGHGDCADF